ncbi:ABC transporter, ATP-binding protein [Dictyocaulus viviparus]|uniref:ABC transporter, ATP-binding protein n=1 Tax=Dictyocaulus viviparus TaxID=29172 RepID=A0A0D8Y3R8_DICVI|nr:ABC transporter, ATP-binding protein [Dictyocaulus viviparus]
MGSSGSGKTTLLNVLTSRNLSGLNVTGSITVNSQRISKWRLREVLQHDMFIGTLTAKEHLLFMAQLRMGSAYTAMEHSIRVDDVIRMMGLTACAETLIGVPNSLKGLSCGEMKRLAFASEILTYPKILLCDEPTSGLDAFMAGHVVSALRRLADIGMTVIITIHQPSNNVYSLFDDVCLMACGYTIYHGPTDGANQLLAKCGYPCPSYSSPADHQIRTIAITDKHRTSSIKTIAICAIITGLVYYNTAITSQTIITINGVLFNNVRNLNFMLQFPAVSAITWELPIILCEISNGIYTSTSYFIGKNLAELPQYIILPVIYNTIVYFMAGLVPSLSSFLFATLICMLLTNVAISISYATATIFKTDTVATAVLPIFVIPMLAFGGFFINDKTIPYYFTWLSALSYFKYSYEGLAINEWEAIKFIPGCFNNTLKYTHCPISGSEVLESINFNGNNKWTDVIILSSMILIFRLISYLALVIRVFYNI